MDYSFPTNPIMEDELETIQRVRDNDPTVKHVYASMVSMSSLEFIENNTHVEMVWIGEHAIEDLSPMERASSVTSLTLCGKLSASLHPLAISQVLKSLTLFSCDITDIEGLRNATIEILDLRGNPIKSVSPLGGNVHLQELTMSYSDVEDISPLVGCTSLHAITITNSKLVNIAPLSKIPAVTSADFCGNLITEVPPLKDTKLEWLGLSQNRLTDISGLKGTISMTGVDLRTNMIRDISILETLPSLEYINIDNTDVESVDTLLSNTTVLNIDADFDRFPMLMEWYKFNRANYANRHATLFQLITGTVNRDYEKDAFPRF